MRVLLAIGIPAWPAVRHPPAGSFDWSPFVMVVAALAVAPIVFGIRLNVRSAGTLVLGGIALGWIGASIGAVPAVCVGVIALAVASPLVRGTRRHRTILRLPD